MQGEPGSIASPEEAHSPVERAILKSEPNRDMSAMIPFPRSFYWRSRNYAKPILWMQRTAP